MHFPEGRDDEIIAQALLLGVELTPLTGELKGNWRGNYDGGCTMNYERKAFAACWALYHLGYRFDPQTNELRLHSPTQDSLTGSLMEAFSRMNLLPAQPSRRALTIKPSNHGRP